MSPQKPAFPDLFSTQAKDYALFRPQYPAEIYPWLASQSPARQIAWDCGTGNGQAAIGLATQFDKVYATDASADQIAQQIPNPKVEYSVRLAESAGFPDKSFDLILVANAIHWFDLDKFYPEVRRSLKPNGIIAAWGIGVFKTNDPAIDKIIDHFAQDILKDYWAVQVRSIAERYRDLPFPFEQITPPDWRQTVQWSLKDLANYYNTWSATQKYLQKNGSHPLEPVYDDLAKKWGDPDTVRTLSIKLATKIGRVNS